MDLKVLSAIGTVLQAFYIIGVGNLNSFKVLLGWAGGRQREQYTHAFYIIIL